MREALVIAVSRDYGVHQYGKWESAGRASIDFAT